MRSFEIARKVNDGVFSEEPAFKDAQLPEYQTKYSAGADFFCAEEITIPSIWKKLFNIITPARNIKAMNEKERNTTNTFFSPTLVHTGVKADMEEDEVLIIANRSSGPKKMGLILANSIGVIDKDYYSNPDNDGEIMFAFFNIKPWDVTIHVGDRIGQGMFQKVLRPKKGLRVKDVTRTGGFGSTK